MIEVLANTVVAIILQNQYVCLKPIQYYVNYVYLNLKSINKMHMTLLSL